MTRGFRIFVQAIRGNRNGMEQVERIMENNAHFILLNIGHAEHNADWNYKQVVSPYSRIYMVEAGHARIHLPNGSFDMEPGYLYIIPAYCMHSYENDGHFSLYYIHLYEEDVTHPAIGENYDLKNKIPLNELDPILIRYLLKINPNKQLHTYNPKLYDNYATFIGNLSSTKYENLPRQIESSGILQVLMSHILSYSTPKSGMMDGRLSKTLVYIRQNLSRQIEVEELARLNCITPEYFSRLFTEKMGESPIKYIQTRKIQRAQLMLTTSRMSVKEIAFAVGFSDVSYFNRVFKKRIGCTPKNYKLQQISIL